MGRRNRGQPEDEARNSSQAEETEDRSQDEEIALGREETVDNEENRKENEAILDPGQDAPLHEEAHGEAEKKQDEKVVITGPGEPPVGGELGRSGH